MLVDAPDVDQELTVNGGPRVNLLLFKNSPPLLPIFTWTWTGINLLEPGKTVDPELTLQEIDTDIN